MKTLKEPEKILTDFEKIPEVVTLLAEAATVGGLLYWVYRQVMLPKTPDEPDEPEYLPDPEFTPSPEPVKPTPTPVIIPTPVIPKPVIPKPVIPYTPPEYIMPIDFTVIPDEGNPDLPEELTPVVTPIYVTPEPIPYIPPVPQTVGGVGDTVIYKNPVTGEYYFTYAGYRYVFYTEAEAEWSLNSLIIKNMDDTGKLPINIIFWEPSPEDVPRPVIIKDPLSGEYYFIFKGVTYSYMFEAEAEAALVQIYGS